MSAKYIPISEPVAEFLYKNRKSGADEDLAWITAFRGMELMHFNTSAEPKTVRISDNGNKTFSFPLDYVQWNKVGLLNERGELLTLIVNDSLTTYKDNNHNRLSSLTTDVNTGSGIVNNMYLNYWDGAAYTPLYGAGYGLQNFGEFRVDEKNDLVIAPSDFKYGSIIFEYISCPEKDYDYKIDRRLRRALIAFLEWEFKLGTRESFYANYIEGDRMMHPFDIQKFQQVVREGSKFCLKL